MIYNKTFKSISNKNRSKKAKTFVNDGIKSFYRIAKKQRTKNKKSDYIKKNTDDMNANKYYLIQINANNSLNNDPPESKTILDNYDYEEAIQFDKRSFWLIYYIVIIGKENILNIFLVKSPLELTSLRICLIIFIYSCDLALNTLFYFNENISEKYHHYSGNNIFFFSLLNNFSISFISTILSLTFVITLNFLTNSKDKVEDLFRKEEKKMRKDNNYSVSRKKRKEILITIYKINKKLKVKIIFFFILEMLLMLFFFYFVTAFCEVYKATQMSWLSDSILSFIISIPIEFLFSLIIAIMYIISIKKKLKWLYNIAMFMYNLG